MNEADITRDEILFSHTSGNTSGRPLALINMLDRQGRLLYLEELSETVRVIIEYPAPCPGHDRTGYSRFVRLAEPIEDKVYALVR